MGNTDGGSKRSTGQHLHFEVNTPYWSNKKNAVDPLLYICDPATKEVQQLLNKSGFKLIVDGITGTATTNAIKEFQKRYGLSVDGSAGPITLSKLREVASLFIQNEPAKQVASTIIPAQKGEIKMLVTKSLTLKKYYQDYLQNAIKNKWIDQKWLNDFNKEQLSIADSILLDKVIEARKAEKK
jgi:hypothetical protein